MGEFLSCVVWLSSCLLSTSVFPFQSGVEPGLRSFREILRVVERVRGERRQFVEVWSWVGQLSFRCLNGRSCALVK